MRLQRGLCPGPRWGAYSAPPDTVAALTGGRFAASGRGQKRGKGKKKKKGGLCPFAKLLRAPCVMRAATVLLRNVMPEAHPQGGGWGGPDPPVFEQRGSGGGPDFCTEAVVCIFTVSVR